MNLNLPTSLTAPRARRLALLTAGVVVAGALVVAAGMLWYRSQEAAGEAALAAATALVQQVSVPQATPEARAKAITALEDVVRSHPRFSGLPRAAYQLGNLRYAAGQYAAARSAYELALAKGARETLKVISALGIGYTWEGEKSYANAATAYAVALAAMDTKGFLYEDTLMALARAQELGGNPATAAETYQRLLKEVPNTTRADDLRMRLSHLKSRPGTQ